MKPAPGPASASARTHAGDGFLVGIQALLEILVLSLFIVGFIVQPFRIPSESMEPTLLVGDFLLVDKQAFAPGGWLDRGLPSTAVHRGDLAVFHYPVNPAMHLVKRIVGLPGDSLKMRDGHLLVNGTLLAEPYAFYSPSRPESFRDDFPSFRTADPDVDPRWWLQLRRSVSDGSIVVPADSFFVLGDNRNDSEDSRYWGFVPRANLVGRPLFVYFSIRPQRAGPVRRSLYATLRAAIHTAWVHVHVLR